MRDYFVVCSDETRMRRSLLSRDQVVRLPLTWKTFRGSSSVVTECRWCGISCLRWTYLRRPANCSDDSSAETSQTHRRLQRQKIGTSGLRPALETMPPSPRTGSPTIA